MKSALSTAPSAVPSATPYEPKLASVAAVIADATRARMLSYLLAGDYASAGELARAASVTPATASGHLGKLMAAELLVCEQRGRHRYYRLADDEVAHALEAVALIAERRLHTAAWANPTRQRLRFARCCYGYLAGKLLKALLAHCLQQGWLRRFDGERALEVTPLGRKHLAALLPSVNAL